MKTEQKVAIAVCLGASTLLAGGVSTSVFKSDSGEPTSHSSDLTPTSHVSGSAPATGKDLFRGIVFGQGATARELGKRPSLAAFYSDQYSQNNNVGKIKPG
jgi:hypothetical protein